MFEKLVQDYNDAIYDTDREQAKQVVQQALDQGITPEQIIFKLVVPAMNQMVTAVSENFDANLAQHFMTAQIASEVTDDMLARIATPPRLAGRIVIGTAAGDLHSLGKKIVIGCLKAHMIESTDLGVDVSAQTFVDAALSRNASVIGISAMMVHTATGSNGPKAVRALLRKYRLEHKIKLIVGGAPFRFDPALKTTVGADAIAVHAIEAAEAIQKLLKETQP